METGAVYGIVWWMLLVGGVSVVFGVIVVWAPLIPTILVGDAPRTLGRDSKEFRNILAEWEPRVLAKRGTVREVKRFANRARFITYTDGDQKPDEIDWDRTAAFVGLVALEQCGVADEGSFEGWCEASRQEKAVPKGWIEKVTEKHWEDYRAAVSGG